LIGGLCTHENQGGRFCTLCGSPLQRRCPACGKPVGGEARFCGECGQPLTAPEPASQAVAPPESLARRILDGRDALEGERKQVTVLFADVSGSMDLAEALDPDDWAQMMNQFFALLTDGVHRYDGTVDKFTGDGVMALFGAPAAYEDHARRACYAALDIIESVNTYADEVRQRRGIGFHVRVGLNSGEVVVGRIGDDARMEYTALGHTVGLAQRMEAMAEPGHVYLTEHTARLTAGFFRLRDLGACVVKGASDPVRVHVLEGSGPRRRGLARWPGRAPLVGRDDELAVLESALARALDGQAQVVGVVGEAGVGKSRLCEEFARSASERGVTVRRAAGLSHARAVPLLPILELLRDFFGITETDGARAAREKIAGRLLLLDPSLSEELPVLFDFLEVPDPDRPAPRLTGEARAKRIMEALHRVSRRRSEQEPLLLLVEDLHWFDPQSAAFLSDLIHLYPGTRTLVLANFRPEFSADWMRQSYYRQLPVAPLGPGAVGELLGNLLGPDPSLAPLLPNVVERTGGNPFFVEELVRALVEDGTLDGAPGAYRLTRPLGDVRVPATVQATLAARIDRLSEREKAALQVASVIGRTFSEPILAAVTAKGAENLTDVLRSLCAAEFLQERAGVGSVEYRFWHPLTQEVAYGSLLSERRARLHAATAAALVDLDPDRLDEHAALIALHYEQAGEGLEAARWQARAVSRVWHRGLGEALQRLNAALTHLEGVPVTDDSLRIGIRARTQIVRVGARAGLPPDETAVRHAEAMELARRLDDHELLTMVTYVGALDAYMRGRLAEARAGYIEAAQMGAASQDIRLKLVTATGLTVFAPYVGPVSEGLHSADETISLAAGDPDLGADILGFSLLQFALRARGELLVLAGRLAEGRRLIELALDQARQRGEFEMIVLAQAAFARLAHLTGEDLELAERAAEILRIGRDTANVWVQVLGVQAQAVFHLLDGQAEAAADLVVEALASARAQHSGLCEEASLLAHLARARLVLGDLDAATKAADEAVDVARHQGGHVLACQALVTRAQVHRTARRSAAAADLDAAALAVAETGAAVFEPFIAEERARLANDEKALAEAAQLFEAIGATGHARRLMREL
jgi:class 3 adenylate cyclase/tetratricopeptide (TPR) repeat protein